MRSTFSSRFTTRLFVVVALLIAWWLAINGALANAPTFDEQGFLVRGLGYIRGQNDWMRVGHPLGLNALHASLLRSDPTVALPTDHPAWQASSFHRPGELFLWEIGNNVEHTMFLARLPTIWMLMLLAAVVYRWTGQLTRSRPLAFLSLSLVAFDPNMLAHSPLTTTDFGLTAATTFCAYALWRYLKQPDYQSILIAGITFAILNNTKFTVALFIPFFALAIVIWWLNEALGQPAGQRWTYWKQRHATFVWLFPLSSFLALWGMYGFQIGQMPQDLPMLGQLSGLTLPLSHHLEQLLDIGNRSTQGASSFLLGEHGNRGWWYYFPVAFVLKTPLPILFVIAGGFVGRLKAKQHDWQSNLLLLLPALGFFGIALTTSVNLGYRHLLPIIPLFVVFGVRGLGDLLSSKAAARPLVAAAALWMATIALFMAPHHLSFFNLLAGGPDNGWRSLVDSNIDWGQDLAHLAAWQAAAPDRNDLWLSYFGEARPDYYGISYRGLDSFPPRLIVPQANPFYPPQPAPGWYAISATNLQGVHFGNKDQFAYFRERPPDAKAGYSIFLYYVEPTGPAQPIALGTGLNLHDLPADQFTFYQTNDIQARWFDSGQSWLLPAGETSQVFVSSQDTERAPACLNFEPIPSWPNVQSAVSAPCHNQYVFEDSAGSVFTNGTDTITLQSGATNVQMGSSPTEISDDQWTFETAWQLHGSAQPLKIFVHITDANDALVTQWDNSGIVADSWQDGDLLLQTHQIIFPADLANGTYTVWVGLYNPKDGRRWQLDNGDRLKLGELQINR